MRTPNMNKEKMKAKHEQDLREDIELLSQGICPWRKQPCASLRDGILVLVTKSDEVRKGDKSDKKVNV